MKIFCSGIGGIGLSAYAALQRGAGHDVYGSDSNDSALIEDLRGQGITISLTQDGSAIPDDCDLFVFSEAIPSDAPERVLASKKGIRSINYFEALGEISKGKKVIAVCGTHGKSSTTAMTAGVLIAAGLDPTVVVGTKVKELDGRNWRKGDSDFFLLEACEYRKSFHFLSPSIVLMTNVDGDHFDAYKDLAEYQTAFTDFLRILPSDGPVITHGKDADCVRVAKESGRTLIDADAFAPPALLVPGEHMRANAQLVLGLGSVLGIDDEIVRTALGKFSGTWRRMERVGDTVHGVPVIDDYGHHPVEIRATLAAMKEAYPGRRIVCAWQPHTHDRTKKLYNDFLNSFVSAQIVIVPNIYKSRDVGPLLTESDIDTFLLDIAKTSGVQTINGKNLEETERILREEILQPEDVLVVMGAGDVTKLAGRMVKS